MSLGAEEQGGTCACAGELWRGRPLPGVSPLGLGYCSTSSKEGTKINIIPQSYQDYILTQSLRILPQSWRLLYNHEDDFQNHEDYYYHDHKDYLVTMKMISKIMKITSTVLNIALPHQNVLKNLEDYFQNHEITFTVMKLLPHLRI
jgi:hypothetical protein